MNAAVEMATAATVKALVRCKDLVSQPFATVEERVVAVQSAYEIGIAEGRLSGMTEMAEQMIATLKS